jgi:two-component system sporulation sensor kinase C
MEERTAESASLGKRKGIDYFRLVADATYDWESWHDAEGRVVWINPAVERIAGYSVQECLQMPRYPLPLVYESDLARVAEIYRGFKDQTSGNDIEFRIRRQSRQIAFVAISWQPMFDPQGVHLGCRTSIRDISERQELRGQITRYNEHLEQLVQEKTDQLQFLERRRAQLEKLAALGQLAAGVAHEINNPLAGIRNAFHLIRADLPKESTSYPLLELVDQEIERLAGMIRNMFNTVGRDAESPKSIDLCKIVYQVVQMLQSSACNRGVKLAVHWGKPEIVAILPEGQVKQVLYNLGRNAIQASQKDQTVLFSAMREQQRVQLIVQDEGAGIDPEILPLIFEPYFTTKGSMAEPSMGLGLSISKSLVDSMGGRIIVQAPSSQGSRFTVELPAGDPNIGQETRADRSELDYSKLPVQQASAQGD